MSTPSKHNAKLHYKKCHLKMRYTLANTFNTNQVRIFVILRLMGTPLQFGICFQHQLCLF